MNGTYDVVAALRTAVDGVRTGRLSARHVTWRNQDAYPYALGVVTAQLATAVGGQRKEIYDAVDELVAAVHTAADTARDAGRVA